MKVKRIVANIAAQNLKKAEKFYGEILGLDLMMDHGWIRTYGASKKMSIQVSFAREGGGGAPVPHLSIEVDNVDEAYRLMRRARFKITYRLTEEVWGVRSFQRWPL